MNHVRPTFGAIVPETKENEEFRKELGAIWRRNSKSNTEFLSIKLSLTKELLKQLAESTEDTISMNLVAFSNRSKEGVESRPDFRIYEERRKND